MARIKSPKSQEVWEKEFVIKKEINDSAKNHGIDTDITKNIQKEIENVKSGIDDFTGPIKRNL